MAAVELSLLKYGCVVQRVAQENDFGKDAYLDFPEGEGVTGFTIALQVRSGTSWRRPGGYGIDLTDRHVEVWLDAPMPVVGIVHDPEKGQLYWCSIRQYLRDTPREQRGSYVPVSSSARLDATTFPAFHLAMLTELQASSSDAILNLATEDSDLQARAVRLLFWKGRFDPRALLLLRDMLTRLRGHALPVAINVLSHATPHPDILWCNDTFPDLRDGNIVKCEVKDAVRASFRWSLEELDHLLTQIPLEEWTRGQVGESLYMLIRQDGQYQRKLTDLLRRSVSYEAKQVAYMVLVAEAHEECYETASYLLELAPELSDDPFIIELMMTAREHGSVSSF